MRPAVRLAAAAAAGALAVGGFAPFGVFALPVVALATLLWLVDTLSVRAAALTGFARAGDEGEVRRARQRLALLYALALSVGGMPMIYVGDEHAQGNDPTPAGDYSAGVDGRQLHRPLFDESRSQDPAAQAVFAELRHLVATRRTCPALAAAVPTQLVAAAAPGLLAFWRGSGLCCLYNFTAHDQHLDLAALEVEGGGSLAGGIDLVTGQPVGREPVLAPWHFVWLQAAPVKA